MNFTWDWNAKNKVSRSVQLQLQAKDAGCNAANNGRKRLKKPKKQKHLRKTGHVQAKRYKLWCSCAVIELSPGHCQAKGLVHVIDCPKHVPRSQPKMWEFLRSEHLQLAKSVSQVAASARLPAVLVDQAPSTKGLWLLCQMIIQIYVFRVFCLPFFSTVFARPVVDASGVCDILRGLHKFRNFKQTVAPL